MVIAYYCPHKISWLDHMVHILCRNIPSRPFRMYFPERKILSRKLFSAHSFSLWILSEIIIEMPVGIVALVNVKHCALEYN